MAGNDTKKELFISLMRCMLEGANELCAGRTEGDPDYTYFGGTVKQHAFS